MWLPSLRALASRFQKLCIPEDPRHFRRPTCTSTLDGLLVSHPTCLARIPTTALSFDANEPLSLDANEPLSLDANEPLSHLMPMWYAARSWRSCFVRRQTPYESRNYHRSEWPCRSRTFHNKLQTLGPERTRAAVLFDIDMSMIGAELVSLFDNECGRPGGFRHASFVQASPPRTSSGRVAGGFPPGRGSLREGGGRRFRGGEPCGATRLSGLVKDRPLAPR